MNEETVSFLNNIDFENTAEVYETISILFEKNQVLKKAIKEGVIATCETCEDFGICPHSYREYDYKNEVEELKNQQKEFIEWLESEAKAFRNSMKEFERSEKCQGDYSIIYYISQYKMWEANDILSKYKEIIGGDNK